jgi:hypothetical protein
MEDRERQKATSLSSVFSIFFLLWCVREEGEREEGERERERERERVIFSASQHKRERRGSQTFDDTDDGD